VDVGAFELDQLPPAAVDDTATTAEDVAVTIDVLANDSDPDAGTLTIVAVTQPAGGTVAISDDGMRLVYTPATNFAGEVTFSYTVSDGQGGTATADVTVTVLSAGQQVDRLRDAVERLVDEDALRPQQGRQLSRELRLHGHGVADVVRVGVFMLHVQHFVRRGILTEAQAQPLLDAAADLQTSLWTGHDPLPGWFERLFSGLLSLD
jgi:hypothetical protein